MKKPKNILTLIFENEQRVLALYKIYAKKISKHKLFWRGLAGEEAVHVKILRDLNAYYRNSDDLFKTNKHIFGIFDYIGSFIESEISRAKSENVSQENALEVALRIEQSMVEKKCFEIIKPEKAEILKVFRRLNKETKGYTELLLKEHQKCCK